MSANCSRAQELTAGFLEPRFRMVSEWATIRPEVKTKHCYD
jgi:hypothetical protein